MTDLDTVCSRQRGFSLLELLVSLGLSGIILVGFSSLFSTSVLQSHDNRIRVETELAARAALDQIAYEVRLAGSGVPLGQSNFKVSNTALSDAPLGVLTTSTESSITFRANTTGESTVLTTDFTPSPGTLSFDVVDTGSMQSGDTIYISNLTTGGEEGLKGTITNISGTTVTINSDYLTSTAAEFPKGSAIEVVEPITYSAPSDWSGLIRHTSSGDEVLVPNAIISIDYYDASHNAIVLPMTNTVAADSLQAVYLTVQVRSSSRLKDGNLYTATASQAIALRNLYINR